MIKLVIFDCDGVVLDSEIIYINSALQVVKENNYPVSLEAIKSVLGVTHKENKPVFMSYISDKNFNYEEYKEKVEVVRKRQKELTPPPCKKGFFELIDFLRQNNIKTGLATSTAKERQTKDLTIAGAIDCFDYMVFGDEIINSKPDPEIYFKVINHFNYSLDEILIIEDSNNGLLSGLNTGAKVIFVPDEANVSEDVQKRVFRKVDSLLDCIQVIKELNKI